MLGAGVSEQLSSGLGSKPGSHEVLRCGDADPSRVRQPHLLCDRSERFGCLSLHEPESNQACGKDPRGGAHLDREQEIALLTRSGYLALTLDVMDAMTPDAF